MIPFLRSISIVILFCLFSNKLLAQANYPYKEGQIVKYELIIEMPNAFVSGILMMVKKSEDMVGASVVNEFGVSLMDFTYNEKRQKVRIHSVIKKLNKWYIKRMLKQDFKSIFIIMRDCKGDSYMNRHKINYQFTLFHEVER